MEKTELWQKGDALRAELLGEGAANRLQDTGIYEDPGMQKLSDYAREAVFGLLWSRDGLDRKMRAIVCVIVDVTTHSLPELALHLRMARRLGWTEDEITEILLHMAGYVGLPPVREAMLVAKQVHAEMRSEGIVA